jgi:hypothetical protein
VVMGEGGERDWEGEVGKERRGEEGGATARATLEPSEPAAESRTGREP